MLANRCRSFGWTLVAVFGIAGISCEPSSSHAERRPEGASQCGDSAPVVTAPPGTGLADGVRVGDLFITASWRVRGDFEPGIPTKAVIHATSGPITLSGFRCRDRRALRFWYGKGPLPFQPPVDAAVLESSGDAAVRLDANPRPYESYGGYIFFPEAGKYVLAAREHNKSVVSVTVMVASSR